MQLFPPFVDLRMLIWSTFYDHVQDYTVLRLTIDQAGNELEIGLFNKWIKANLHEVAQDYVSLDGVLIIKGNKPTLQYFVMTGDQVVEFKMRQHIFFARSDPVQPYILDADTAFRVQHCGYIMLYWIIIRKHCSEERYYSKSPFAVPARYLSLAKSTMQLYLIIWLP